MAEPITSRTINWTVTDGSMSHGSSVAGDEHVEHGACRAGGDSGWKRDLHGAAGRQ